MLGQAAPRLPAGRLLARPALDPALFRQLAAALLAGALAETLMLRLGTRIGVHLPRGRVVSTGIELASLLGTIALNFTSILAVALTLVLLATLVARLEEPAAKLGLAVLSVAMLAGLGLSLAAGSPEADALFGFTMTLLVVVVGTVLVNREEVSPAGRVALGLMVGAYVCYQYYTLGHLATQLLDYTAPPPLAISVLRAGEGLVVLAAGAAFWAWGRERWRNAGFVGMALVIGLVLAVGLSSLAPSSTTSILALWTTGLSFFLPLPVYLTALALFLLTVFASWRSRDSFWIGTGLLLLLLAGYMPEATYHHLLLLLGIAFLSGAARLREASPPDTVSDSANLVTAESRLPD